MYRTAGLIDQRIAATGGTAAATLQALEEFAVEASIAKVYGSETVDYVDRRGAADLRRQRLRRRLPDRAPLPRRARQPHLRGHQRDQPAAHPRHADQEGAQGRPAADGGGQGAAGRDPRAAGDARGRRPAGRRGPRRRRIQEGGAAGRRARPCSDTATSSRTSRKCCRTWPTWSSTPTSPSRRCCGPARRSRGRLTPPCTWRRRPRACTKRPAASSCRRAAPWPPWPRATRSACSWRRCGACSS